MAKVTRQCGTCRHWVAQLDRNGRRVYSADPHNKCAAPIPELPALPESIRVNDHGFNGVRWPPTPTRMGRGDGRMCLFWANWKEEKA